MSVITEQTVHIVCGYLTYIDIIQLSYFWSSFFVGNAGPLMNGVGLEAIPLSCFLWKYVARLVSWKFALCHSSKYVRMSALSLSALSESRQRLCISHLDFLINTHRSLFPQEDIKNDLHVVWFESETRGILIEEGFQLII